MMRSTWLLVLSAFALLGTTAAADGGTDNDTVALSAGVEVENTAQLNLSLAEVTPMIPVLGSGEAPEAGEGLAPPAAAHATTTHRATQAAAGLTLALALAYLGKLLGVGLFSRVEGEEVLEHPTRRLMLQVIESNPAISLSDLVRAAGVGWGTAVFHLRRLEAERLVVSERIRGRRHYFRNGGPVANDDKRPFAELRNDTALQIARAVLQRPGAHQKELCEAVGVKAPVAHKYLERMADANLVEKQRDWRSVKYFPTPQLAVWA